MNDTSLDFTVNIDDMTARDLATLDNAGTGNAGCLSDAMDLLERISDVDFSDIPLRAFASVFKAITEQIQNEIMSENLD